METHWIFSGCDAEDETLVARYWDERLLELEGKLNALPEEPSELHIAVHHDDGGPAWEAQLALHLPGTTLAAESAGDELAEVLDDVVCQLARQMDEHMDEHDVQPVATAESSFPSRSGGLAALLRRNHAQGRSDAFFALLQPVMRRMTGYLCQALHTMESEDGLPCEEVSPDDVVNEALTCAWERFGTFAHDRPLDQWLRELVEGVLHQSHRPLAEQSLDDEVAEAADDADDPLRDAWTEPGGYPQTIELAELIAGHRGVDDWDRLSAEADKSGLAEALGKLPRDQRQSLVLSLTEGFSAAEIADFQGRSTNDVEEDIRLAQQALRRELDGSDFEALEAQLTAARHKTRGRR